MKVQLTLPPVPAMACARCPGTSLKQGLKFPLAPSHPMVSEDAMVSLYLIALSGKHVCLQAGEVQAIQGVPVPQN